MAQSTVEKLTHDIVSLVLRNECGYAGGVRAISNALVSINERHRQEQHRACDSEKAKIVELTREVGRLENLYAAVLVRVERCNAVESQ
jgi:hypothetical protein